MTGHDSGVAGAPIALRDVRKTFGKVQALRGVTGEIGGRVVGLLGPNGAGKSTLIKALLGLLEFDGEATVFGLSPKTDGAAIRDRVGYMPEHESFLTGLSAVELCRYAAELSGLPSTEALQRSHAALYYAGLGEKRYAPLEDYSTGMKQRVKLAQALVHDPELLILDEPTNGLDPRSREEMLDLVAEMPEKRGCTVVLSTHILSDIERVCDRVVIMHQGAIRYTGTIAELKQSRSAGSAYQVTVRDTAPALVDALNAAGAQATGVSATALVTILGSKLAVRDLFAIAGAARVQVRSVELERESMEQAFLRVIGAASEQDARQGAGA
ncbi:MAG: ABC transporter ATP-binding protein [Myxococcales bacterium]|nr:ABC transporter ATP-binding protein [Myxococcales bacterium]